MSRAIVEIQQGSFGFSFGLIEQFIDVCPDEIWGEKFGGWPVWQQIYHALDAIHFFVAAPDAAPVTGPAPQAVGSLAEQGGAPLSKAEIKAFAQEAKAASDAYMNGLTDELLPQLAEGASKRMGRDTPHAVVMALMSSHLLYHLGSCDAALRQNGLQGVF